MNATVATLRREGVCIIDSLSQPDVLHSVAMELAPFVQRTPPGHNDFTGTETRRTGAVIARSTMARTLISHPFVVEVATQLVGEAIQLNHTELISLGPGETAQPLHRDQEVWPFAFPVGYQPELSAMWPVNVDFTDFNGATRLIPGSHNDLDEPDEPCTPIAACLSVGSVLLWFGSTLHGGGANNSGEVRQGLNVSYSAAWLRQEENQFLTTPTEVARHLDTDLTRLIGYSRPVPGLGNAEDRSDPFDWLQKRHPTPRATVPGGGLAANAR